MTPRSRIAPTPSGYLHLGNAVNFALTAALAQSLNAGLFLRVDDLDAARARPEYREDIRETIAWLLPELAPDLLAAPVLQSERLHVYRDVLGGLRQNALLFACSCTRRELAAAREATAREAGGVDVNDYPGTCRGRGLDLDAAGVAWRMRESGVVVRQKDGAPSYQLASLVDDCALGVTHLVRGEDLRRSTELQRELARHLGYARFAGVRAWHHPLLTDARGNKLSKSAGAASVRALRVAGASRGHVFAKAGQLLGASGVTDLAELTYAVGESAVDWV